jgi:hypothetical protein
LIGTILSYPLLLAALVSAAPIPPPLFAGAPPKGTVTIAVGCEGSWKLRYKLYYHEIADSKAREVNGIGKRAIAVSAERELVNICEWLTPTGIREQRERLSLSIIVDDGSANVERQALRSPFSKKSSICIRF